MCGRYALYGPQSRYRGHFDVEAWPDFGARYNIAPSLWVPIVRRSPEGRRVADLLRWGLVPHWAQDESIGARLINARGESMAEKPSFRSAYRHRRCLVPAEGFYEWQAVPGQKWKQPWFVRVADGAPMALGGLWESWTDAQGAILRSFAIVTVAANATMAPIHERMPLLLAPGDFERWLDPACDPARVAALVAPAPASAIEVRRVGRKVSDARQDDAGLIEPA